MTHPLLKKIVVRNLESLEEGKTVPIRGKRWVSSEGHTFTRFGPLLYITIPSTVEAGEQSIAQVRSCSLNDMYFIYSIDIKNYIVNREDISPWIDLWDGTDIRLAGNGTSRFLNGDTNRSSNGPIIQHDEISIIQSMKRDALPSCVELDKFRAQRLEIEESMEVLSYKAGDILKELTYEVKALINTKNFSICQLRHSGDLLAYGRDYGPLVTYGGWVYFKVATDKVRLISSEIQDQSFSSLPKVSEAYRQGYERIHGGTMLPSGHWIHVENGVVTVNRIVFDPTTSPNGEPTIKVKKGITYRLSYTEEDGHKLSVDSLIMSIDLESGTIGEVGGFVEYASDSDVELMGPISKPLLWLDVYLGMSDRIERMNIKSEKIDASIEAATKSLSKCDGRYMGVLAEYIDKTPSEGHVEFHIEGQFNRLFKHGDVYLDGHYAYVNTPSYGMEVLCRCPDAHYALARNGRPTLKDFIDHWEQ